MPTAAELTRVRREGRVTDSADLLRSREIRGVTRDIRLPLSLSVAARTPAYVRERGGLLSNLVMPETFIADGHLALTTTDGRSAELVVDQYSAKTVIDRRPSGVTFTQTRVGEGQYVVDIEQRRTAQQTPARERLLVEAGSGDAALGDALGYLAAKQGRLQSAHSLDIFIDQAMIQGQEVQILRRAGIAIRDAYERPRTGRPSVVPIPTTEEYAPGAVDDPRMLIPVVRHASTLTEEAAARALSTEEIAEMDREGSGYRDAVIAGVKAEIYRIFLDPTAKLSRYRTDTPRTTKTRARIPGEERWNSVVAVITTRDGTGEVLEYGLESGGSDYHPIAIEVTNYRGHEPHVSTRTQGSFQQGWRPLGNDEAQHEQFMMRHLKITPREVAPVAAAV